MKTCAIVGINWGDEGKGRMVDLLTRDYDIVVRYQGGGNAGHTVINEYGKFALHLLPSGIFRPNVVNILGNGVALDMKSLCGEMESVAAKGVSVTPDNLKISDRASLVLPWHILLDELEEERLKDKNTALPSRESPPSTLTNIRKRRFRPASSSIRNTWFATWRTCWNGRT